MMAAILIVLLAMFLAFFDEMHSTSFFLVGAALSSPSWWLNAMFCSRLLVKTVGRNQIGTGMLTLFGLGKLTFPLVISIGVLELVPSDDREVTFFGYLFGMTLNGFLIWFLQSKGLLQPKKNCHTESLRIGLISTSMKR